MTIKHDKIKTTGQKEVINERRCFNITTYYSTVENNGFQLGVIKPKPKLSLWPITKVADNPMTQSKLVLNTCS